MLRLARRLVPVVLLLSARTILAAAAPVVASFTAQPAAPVPGQSVTLTISARDPDCTAPPCTTACGTAIRTDLLVWSDDTGRTPSPFSGSTATPTGSPWSATVTWIAPPADGTYTVRASLTDNGGMLCGGRQTRVATLQIIVSSAPVPVIDSLTVSPSTLTAGSSATLTASARDPLGRPLTYTFSADAGFVVHASPSSPTATWTAPKAAGVITLRCTVTAGGSVATAQTTASVAIGSYAGTLSPPGLRITRVAAIGDGSVAAIDGAEGVLAAMTTTGSVVWRVNGLSTPVGITVSGGEIFVLERGAARISVWSVAGQRIRELPLDATLANQLVAGPGSGELTFSDTGAARVKVVSAFDGTVLRTIGAGTLKFPAGIAVVNGGLAVADSGAARVVLFGPDGAVRATLGDSTIFVRPQGVAWDALNESVVVSDSFSGEISVLAADGTVRGALGGFGTAEGKLVNPIDVAVLGAGVLAVATGGGELSLFRLADTLPPLRAPQNVFASDRRGDDGGAIEVTWLASADVQRVTAQRVERAVDDTFAPIGTVSSNATSFVDLTARDGVCYQYRVVATDGAADATSSPSLCATARNDLAPPAVASVFAVVTSPTSATIKWTASPAPDLSGYTVDLGSKRLETSGTSVVLDALEAGTSYEVVLRAVDVAGNTSGAATTTFTTYSATPPPAPANVTAVDLASGGTVQIAWTAPATALPIARYRVLVTPEASGWPSPSLETTETSIRVTGLVNRLAYSVTVIAVTPWNRDGESAPAVRVTPTAPVRTLPFVEESDAVVDAAGMAIDFTISAERRDLRLQYRATGTALIVMLDGFVMTTLGDTGGVWSDAALVVEKKLLRAAVTHQLQLSSSAFPAATARLALRRVDFVPLIPKQPSLESYNTVVDILWRWDEWRPDLGIAITRDGAEVRCSTPAMGRCRDTFLENDRKSVWRFAAVSPAGWMSEALELRGHAKFDGAPPPVTDAFVSKGTLSWTPLSCAIAKDGAPAAVVAYRVYAAGTLIREVAAPPVDVSGFDPQTLVVRSVDSAGRESR